MTGPTAVREKGPGYLETFTVKPWDRDRLRQDAEFVRQAFERLLGPPDTDRMSRSGWVHYPCPMPGCVTNRRGHFGVHYGSSTRLDTVGGFRCLKCGAKGGGFIALCRLLGQDPGQYVEGSGLLTQNRRPETAPTPEPLSPRALSEFWSFVLGPDGSPLSALLAENLAGRALEPARLPPWFTMPHSAVFDRARAFHGDDVCRRAGVFTPEGRLRAFAEAGRLGLVYPTAPWLGEDAPYGFVRSYQPGGRVKMLSAAGSRSEEHVYVRASPEGRPRSWLITEGEIKAEASFQAGVPSLGLPGQSAAHGRAAAVVSRALELSQGRTPRALCLCFDRMDTAKEQANTRRAERSLAETVVEHVRREHGLVLPVCYLVPPGAEGEKVDIDSYLGDRAGRDGLAAARRHWVRLVRQALQSVLPPEEDALTPHP